MAKTEHKDFGAPDEVRSFEHGKAEILEMEGGTIGRLVLNPGWRWSVDVKPVAGTEWCEAPHFQYHASGILHVKMQDGSEFEVGPGTVSYLPSGHDAWVVGDETVTLIDWHGAKHYAES
jgi:hypothetical protein